MLAFADAFVIVAAVLEADRNEGRREVGRGCPTPIRYCGDVDQAKSGVVGLT